MPKSQRQKLVHLSKTRKKASKESKSALMQEVRDLCDEHSHIFVFSVENMRNNIFQEVRSQWTNSRFLMGRNKVVSVALGKNAEHEYKANLSQVTQHLIGQRGLLFTNSTTEEVLEFFSTFKRAEFPKTGFVAKEDFIVKEGPLPDMQFSMEPSLRKLGLPVKLNRGVIEVLYDYTVCQAGDELTPNQATLLRHFGQKQAVFEIVPHCVWTNDTFQEFEAADEDEDFAIDED